MIFFILFILVILEQTPETNDRDEFFKKRDAQVGEIMHSDSSYVVIKKNK